MLLDKQWDEITDADHDPLSRRERLSDDKMRRMTDADGAQARLLLSALREQIREMTPKLDRAERDAVCGHTTRARAIRQQAAQLRCDVSRAQFLIAQLHRRFPDIDATEVAVGQALTDDD